MIRVSGLRARNMATEPRAEREARTRKAVL